MGKEVDDIIEVISIKGLNPLNNFASKAHTTTSSMQYLNKILELSRKIFFFGYFGSYPFNQKTLKHNIGSKIAILYKLLSAEIKKIFQFANNNEKNANPDKQKQKVSDLFAINHVAGIVIGATILGRITVGKKSIIGGNMWIAENVSQNSKIVLS